MYVLNCLTSVLTHTKHVIKLFNNYTLVFSNLSASKATALLVHIESQASEATNQAKTNKIQAQDYLNQVKELKKTLADSEPSLGMSMSGSGDLKGKKFGGLTKSKRR